jgi:hypothetical protein
VEHEESRAVWGVQSSGNRMERSQLPKKSQSESRKFYTENWNYTWFITSHYSDPGL